MSFSLNEVEATARKAARGAGYPWGIADEAGAAVRRLCVAGVDGVLILAALLEGAQGRCPFTLGVQVSDQPDGVFAADLTGISCPALLLPFLGYAAGNRWMRATWGEGMAWIAAQALIVEGASSCRYADRIELAWCDPPEVRPPQQRRATPHPDSWSVLLGFAQRTYAPATELSRRIGAGAGLSDND